MVKTRVRVTDILEIWCSSIPVRRFVLRYFVCFLAMLPSPPLLLLAQLPVFSLPRTSPGDRVCDPRRFVADPQGSQRARARPQEGASCPPVRFHRRVVLTRASFVDGEPFLGYPTVRDEHIWALCNQK